MKKWIDTSISRHHGDYQLSKAAQSTLNQWMQIYSRGKDFYDNF